MFLGIDLGTTYSVGAYINSDGEAEVISNSEGAKTTPSAVYIDAQENVTVGQVAKEMATAYPKDVILFVKNLMGKCKDGKPEVCVTSHGTYAPEFISANILMKVASDASAFLGQNQGIRDVVVTIPAYFDDSARKATEDAIAIAGLNRLALINEPTAAAFYYASRAGIENCNILVYDLGGGTFDVTIVHLKTGGNVEVLSTGGLSRVGGSFFDKEIALRVAKYIKDNYGTDINSEEFSDVYQDVLLKAEKCKIALSSSEKTVLTVRVNGNTISIPFTRDDINDIVTSLYNRTEVVVNKALKEAGLEITDISKVIMVGGSSRIPFIAEHLEEYFGQKPSREVNPDEVVALGAALYGKQLTDEKAVRKTIVDVCSHSIGITALDPKTGENYNDILIPKNSRLPASVEKVYSFAEDNIEDIYLNVLEGERKEIKFSNEICATNVRLPGKLGKGQKVYVKLEIDKHQILHIFIRLPDAGNMETEVSFDRKGNMSEAQIQEWKKSAVRVKEIAAEKSEEKESLGKKILSGIFGKSEDDETKNVEKNSDKKEEKKPEAPRDKSKEIPKIIQNSMEGIVGMDEVREGLRDIKNRFDMARKRGALGQSDFDNRCIAVLGKGGMGMTTAAGRIAKTLYDIGISSLEEPVWAYYDDIVKNDEAETVEAIQNLFQSAMGGVLIIDEFEDFYSENENFAGMVAIKFLQKAFQKTGGKLTLFIAGEGDKIQKLFEVKPEFERLFSTYSIQLLGYTPEEYVTILHQYAAGKGYVVDDEADPYLEAYFKKICGQPNFNYIYSVIDVFEKAKTDVANKASAKRHATDYDYSIIHLENFGITEKVKSLEELKKELNGLTGLQNAKDKINEIIKIQENTIRKAKQEGRAIGAGLGSMHMVFTGEPGTGKTTVARLVGEIYRELGVLKIGQFVEVTRKDLVSDIVGRTQQLVEDAVNKAIGGILFIDEAYSLYQDDNDSFGKEAVDTLVPLIENHRDELMVIMAGYSKDMDEFIDKANTGLASRFNTYIEFENYTLDELMVIFDNCLEKDKYILEGAAREALRQLLDGKMRNPKFGNARGVRNLYEEIHRRQMARLADMKDWGANEEHIFREIDVTGSEESVIDSAENLEALMAELDALTGLQNAKAQVRSLINSVRINKVRQDKGIKPNDVGTMHMIFAGSAGTGKTTVARLIGKIYKALGVLSVGNTIEVSRSDFVGGYIGQTEPKTEAVINRSIGSVLFIDEAYSLVRPEENDYGHEAVEILLKKMEDYRDSMVVILAGYSDKMRQFLEDNEGLTSRFKNWIEFENYSLEEMYEIFCRMIEKDELTLAPDAVDLVKQVISEKSAAKDFGNARGVRNLADDFKAHMNDRLVRAMDEGIKLSDADLSTICREDIY